ncbi:MAG: hypothetical protein ACOYOU_16625 [Kiritimatiellia bacterium]
MAPRAQTTGGHSHLCMQIITLPIAKSKSKDAQVAAKHGLFLKHHISRIFNRQDAKYAKFPRRCLFAGQNIEFVGLGDLGVLAVGKIVRLQEKTMGGQRPGC